MILKGVMVVTMKQQKNYKIVFNCKDENPKIIFAISKLVNYLEQHYKNEKFSVVNFSSINYNDESQSAQRNGEITLQVNTPPDILNENFKNKLDSIIEEIRDFYKSF